MTLTLILSIMLLSSICIILYLNSLTSANKKETERRAIAQMFRKPLQTGKAIEAGEQELEEAV